MQPHLMQNFHVRAVLPSDEQQIGKLLNEVYPSDSEARLVEKLRHCGALVLEQVAIDGNNEIIGHVAYSRVTPAAIGAGQALKIVCLAPVSVHPAKQRSGVGCELVKDSQERLKGSNEDLVLVLGPPSYFPRFGFDGNLAKKIRGPYSGAAFMALALNQNVAQQLPIEVAFATPFEEFE